MKEVKELFSQRVRRDSKKVTWLHGLVHCSACGKKLVRSAGVFMQCGAYSKGLCKTSHSIKYERLEDLTLEVLQRDFTDPIDVTIVPKVSDYENRDQYELITKQLEAFKGKLERIKTAYQNGIDTLEDYRTNKTHLEAERGKVKARLAELRETLLTADDAQPIEKRLKDVYDLLTDETIDFEIKYQTAHFLINKITYEKKEKVLKLEYKF